MQIVTNLPKPNGGTTFFKVPNHSIFDFDQRPGWLQVDTKASILWFNLANVAAIVTDFDFPRKVEERG